MLDNNFDLDKHIELLPMQKGDVEITYSDTSKLEKDFNFVPKTSLRDGLKTFCNWYKEYLNKVDYTCNGVNNHADENETVKKLIKSNYKTLNVANLEK